MDDYRESIWGIRHEDRKWFQIFTVVGGITGSVILTVLELEHRSIGSSPSELARNIVLGIGASFVASGFAVWGLLQARELMSAMADWIREATRRRRERWMEAARAEGREEGRKQGREEGLELGREEGRLEALREIYGPNYQDSSTGDSAQSPHPGDQDGVNGADANGAPDR